MDRQTIISAIERNKGNLLSAAWDLNRTLKSLYNKMKDLQISTEPNNG